jgi:hypothetical protein
MQHLLSVSGARRRQSGIGCAPTVHFALQSLSGSVIFSAALTGVPISMAILFHTPTTDRLAGQDAGTGARFAFAGAFMVEGGAIVPAGRRAR